jgi:hypothetical protein
MFDVLLELALVARKPKMQVPIQDRPPVLAEVASSRSLVD